MSRKKNDRTNLNSYIEKGTMTIFNTTVIVIIFGYAADMVNYYKVGNFIYYNNLIAGSLTIAAFAAYHFSVVKMKVSYAFIIYIALLNISVAIFTDFAPLYKLDFFLRNSLFIMLLLTLASLISNKIHAIIMGVLYVGGTLILNILLDKEFLHSSIILIIITVSSYSVIVYYFVDILEKSIFEREQQNQLIKEQNEIS